MGGKIGQDEIHQVFDLFYRGKDALDRSIAGTGIGLALVKGLVELLKGKVELVNDPKEEEALTTVTLMLPSLTPPSIQ